MRHDDEADRFAGLAEIDVEAYTEDLQGQGKVEGYPFEAAGEANGYTDDQGEATGANAVDRADVRGCYDRLGPDDYEGRVEIRTPEHRGRKEADEHHAAEEYAAVKEEGVRDEGRRGEVLFVDDEEDYEEATDDNEREDEWGSPLFTLVGVKTEGEEEEGHACG